MRRWLEIGGLVCGLIMAQISVSRAADYTLRLNHTLPATHLRQQDAEQFREMIASATHGRVDVQIFPAGQLYRSDQDAIKAVRSGAIEGAMVTTGDLALFAPAFNLFETPFLITSYGQLDAIIDSPLSGKILAKLEPLGIKGLAYTDAGSAIIATRPHPINAVGDIKGLRLRAAAGRLQIRALEMLGASAIQLSVADIGPALERGTIDGVLTTPSALADMQIGGEVKYGSWTGQQFFPPVVIVNLRWWNSLPEDIRNEIYGGLKQFELTARKLNLQAEDRAIAALGEQGIKVIKLDKVALDGFRDKLEPLHSEARKLIGPDIYDQALQIIHSTP